MNIIICSAYRSVEKQEQVFNSSVQDRLNTGMNYWEAYSDTAMSVALPGTSEHGLGLALDLTRSWMKNRRRQKRQNGWKRTVISMGLFFVIRRKKQPRQELSMSLGTIGM